MGPGRALPKASQPCGRGRCDAPAAGRELSLHPVPPCLTGKYVFHASPASRAGAATSSRVTTSAAAAPRRGVPTSRRTASWRASAADSEPSTPMGDVRRGRPRWHQPSRPQRRNPASAVGRAVCESAALRSGDRGRPTPRSCSRVEPVGGLHFLRRYDDARRGRSACACSPGDPIVNEWGRLSPFPLHKAV
jgi:hypothetical protein